jgi:membrane fusion protein (multidrug efflux system)
MDRTGLWRRLARRARAVLALRGSRATGALLVAGAMLALAGCSDRKPAGQAAPKPPPVVSAITTEAGTASLERVYPARVRAVNEVEVRAQVAGILLERKYREGARVEAGAQLFVIDPAPYEARMAQADAERQRAQADLRQAQREWQRVESLYKSNTVSARQYDEARSALELAQAALANAEASRRTAAINLGYTRVTAPIAGVTGLQAVAPGNLVEAGTLLTTIRQLDPVHVLFSMSEPDALAVRRQFGFVGAAGRERPRASIVLADGTRHAAEGEIDYVAANVDDQTGTVQARAVFPNADGVLVPGQFVRISVLGLTVPDAIVVPAKAIVEGPLGPGVYVIAENGIARERPVKLGASTPQGQVVEEGLKPGERVIVDGIGSVRPGMEVREEGR